MSFSHGPAIGDTLYCLPVIKHFKIGSLYLNGNGHYNKLMASIVPFIKNQSYIQYCGFNEGVKADKDFNFLSLYPVKKRWKFNLIQAHFLCLGLYPPKEYDAPWLEAGSYKKYIIVNRSVRYRAKVDYSFLKGFPDVRYVGFESHSFMNSLGIKHLKTRSFEELADIINSCKVFIGNQSSPLALAVGFGKNRLIEECPWWPNCTFDHLNEYKLTNNPQINLRNLKKLLEM